MEDAAIKILNIVIEMFSLANQFNSGTLKEATKIYIVENKKILGQQDLGQVPSRWRWSSSRLWPFLFGI